MATFIGQPPDVQYLSDKLLDGTSGRIKLLPSSAYAGIDSVHLAIWSASQARYALPTTELVDWLKTIINGRKAIEIAAGNGDLGYHLGVPMSDNYCQQLPHVKLYYEALRQTPTSPLPGVERLDAIAAIEKHRPEVVIGSYVTQKYREGDASGNMYGPDEEDILRYAKCYIHIGNEATHGDKRIRRLPHQTLRFDWLVTRSLRPESNVIYVWGV